MSHNFWTRLENSGNGGTFENERDRGSKLTAVAVDIVQLGSETLQKQVHWVMFSLVLLFRTIIFKLLLSCNRFNPVCFFRFENAFLFHHVELTFKVESSKSNRTF